MLHSSNVKPIMDAETGDLNQPYNELDIFEVLTEFERTIAHSSFETTVRSALRFLSDVVGVGRASVALLRDDRQGFCVFDSTMQITGVESGRFLPHGSATLSETVEEERAIYRQDIREWPRTNLVDQAFAAAGLLCTLSVPLRFGGSCRGSLNVAVSRTDGLPLNIRQLIELLAPRLAYALEVGQALDALAESEARFRLVFEAVGEGLIVADTATKQIRMANPAACALLGRSEAEILGMDVAELHPLEQMQDVRNAFNAMLSGSLDTALDIPIVRRNGTVLLVDITSRSTVIDKRPCVVGLVRDANERRTREQEISQVQKLESIRTLAAGIAHDFNNLLTGVIGNLTLALMQVDEASGVQELLADAEIAATRATALTRQLLTFSKGGAPVRGLMNLPQVLRDAASLATSGSNVQCQFEFPEGTCTMMGDAGQLTQVFQNLVRNAVDAMPNGGVVTIAVARERQDAGEMLCIEVRDQGSGIAPEHLDQIYTPFFSTKRGKSGLGLAVASSVVHNHGGHISVESTPGLGSSFLVCIPISGPHLEPISMKNNGNKGTGRVLIMDDESLVLDVATRALRLAGYHTMAVTNGADAVEHYREALELGQRYDAVVLDWTIPGGMGGKEAAQEILTLDPGARLMVSSGYSEDSAMAEYRAHGFTGVLPKPYSATQLCDAVRALMPAQ